MPCSGDADFRRLTESETSVGQDVDTLRFNVVEVDVVLVEGSCVGPVYPPFSAIAMSACETGKRHTLPVFNALERIPGVVRGPENCSGRLDFSEAFVSG